MSPDPHHRKDGNAAPGPSSVVNQLKRVRVPTSAVLEPFDLDLGRKAGVFEHFVAVLVCSQLTLGKRLHV